jgi:hypothetical protein
MVAGGIGVCGDREAMGGHGECALWRLRGGPRPGLNFKWIFLTETLKFTNVVFLIIKIHGTF